MFDDGDGHLLDIFDSHNGTSKGAHLGTIHFPIGTSALIMDGILAGAVFTKSGRREPAPRGSMAGLAVNPVQGFRTGRAVHWEFLRLRTGFELSSSCRALP